MSQFRGFTCDECGCVIAEGMRTKHTERFDGPVVQGEVSRDLCVECVRKRAPEDEGALRPLRRRKSSKKAASKVA